LLQDDPGRIWIATPTHGACVAASGFDESDEPDFWRSLGSSAPLVVKMGREFLTAAKWKQPRMVGQARMGVVDDLEKVSPATILPMRFLSAE
jgi:hypothetical protein